MISINDIYVFMISYVLYESAFELWAAEFDRCKPFFELYV